MHRPERWGDRSPGDALRALKASPEGLSAQEAERRRRTDEAPRLAHPLLEALQDNLRSPLTAVVAAGTGLTLLGGSRADASILALTLAANVSSSRILLEGSDVLMGHGRAVVVAVGPDTRMGATTAAVLARNHFAELFYIDDGLIRDVYAAMFYVDPLLPVPNWPRMTGTSRCGRSSDPSGNGVTTSYCPRAVSRR